MELGNMVFGNSRGKHLVNRDWQNTFCEYLSDMGFDGYGVADSEELNGFLVEVKSAINEPAEKFENDVFVIMPYYWGDDDDLRKLPNFVFKPTGFELSWYKYALRDSYMNQDVTYQELVLILKKCKESLGTTKERSEEELRHLLHNTINVMTHEQLKKVAKLMNFSHEFS